MAEEPYVHPVADQLPPHPVLDLYRDGQEEVSERDLCEQLRVSRVSDSGEEQELGYVVELYGFQPVLKTRDLVAELQVHFGTDEFRLKWVDDTHALSIFTSSALAHQASRITFPRINARILALASEQSKAVARKVAGDMRPLAADGGGLQPRPKTTAMVARRFVCNALGVRVNISKEQRDKERRELTEAKEQRGVEGKGRRVKEVEAGGERKEEAVVAVSASKEQREVEEDKEKGVREEGGADKNEEQELGEAKVASKEQGELMKPKALSKELAEDTRQLESKPRPKITATVARRLVCDALGVNTDASKDQRKKGRELREAREDKRRVSSETF